MRRHNLTVPVTLALYAAAMALQVSLTALITCFGVLVTLGMAAIYAAFKLSKNHHQTAVLAL